MTEPATAHITHIIVAAGSGSRFGGDIPKQFQLLHGYPVLMHSITALSKATPGASIMIVLSENHIELWRRLCDEYSFVSPPVVYGGTTRWESVRNALHYLPAPGETDIITIHDGARPLVSTRIVSDVVDACRTHSGAIPAIPITDSVRSFCADGMSEALDRSRLRAVQTPQAFNASKLMEAYRLPYRDTFTDDAAVMTAAGHADIVLTDGDPANIKITRPLDMAIAELLMRGV